MATLCIQDVSLKCLFCLKIQRDLTKIKRKQQMLPFEKLDPLNAWYFTLKQDVSAMLMHTSVAKMCVCTAVL